MNLWHTGWLRGIILAVDFKEQSISIEGWLELDSKKREHHEWKTLMDKLEGLSFQTDDKNNVLKELEEGKTQFVSFLRRYNFDDLLYDAPNEVIERLGESVLRILGVLEEERLYFAPALEAP